MADNPLLFSASIILFAVISWAIYKYVLTANNNNAGPHRHRGPEPSSSTAATAATTGASTNSTATVATNNSSTKEESSSSSLYNNFDQPKRHPPHLYNPTNKLLHPSKVENGGIIPFKLTFASGYETRLSSTTNNNTNNNNGETEEHNENVIITNRKQRARLFAKLFTIADRPPNRGSNVVVIISYGSNAGNNVAKCHKLQKSLMLLGTYYNLFLLVDYSQYQQQQQKEKEEELDREVVKQFRNDLLNVTKNDNESSSSSLPTTTATANKLNPQILPPHRIIFTTTPEGKIAFVRQLHEAKLVLMGSSSNNKEKEEDDNNNKKVKVELERFGFRVVSYPEENCGDGSGEEGVSALGQFLIP